MKIPSTDKNQKDNQRSEFENSGPHTHINLNFHIHQINEKEPEAIKRKKKLSEMKKFIHSLTIKNKIRRKIDQMMMIIWVEIASHRSDRLDHTAVIKRR